MVPVILLDPEGGLSQGRALVNPRYVQMVIPGKLPKVGRLCYRILFIDKSQVYVEQSPDVWEGLVKGEIHNHKVECPFSPEEGAPIKVQT